MISLLWTACTMPALLATEHPSSRKRCSRAHQMHPRVLIICKIHPSIHICGKSNQTKPKMKLTRVHTLQISHSQIWQIFLTTLLVWPTCQHFDKVNPWQRFGPRWNPKKRKKKSNRIQSTTFSFLSGTAYHIWMNKQIKPAQLLATSSYGTNNHSLTCCFQRDGTWTIKQIEMNKQAFVSCLKPHDDSGETSLLCILVVWMIRQ
jgi:hypothetical protein